MEQKTKFENRFLARITIEAQTPLLISNGNTSLTSDSIILKDWNGMPYILGTTITGVLRHLLEDSLKVTDKNDATWHNIFGYEEEDTKEGNGSRIKISNACMILDKDKVSEVNNIDIEPTVRQKFSNLPIRQHVKLNNRAVKIDGGLFNNEVVFKGSRFIFEIELKGNEVDKEKWNTIIKTINNSVFRIGGGTRNGYGKIVVISIQEKIFNLGIPNDFNEYLAYNPSLSSVIDWNFNVAKNENNCTEYVLKLIPDSLFFHFGGPVGDDEVDNKPLIEEIVVYNEAGNMNFAMNPETVIPATSIKGAISHRTCFHYNRLIEKWADLLNPFDTKARNIQIELLTGKNNEAVYELFGAESGTETKAFAQRGNVIIDDVFISENQIDNDKIFNHVAIDRFTGGALDSALFSEKVTYKSDGIELKIVLTKEFGGQILGAFEEALKDICKGLLPLGGMTTKGHGIFTGSLKKDNTMIYNYSNNIKEN